MSPARARPRCQRRSARSGATATRTAGCASRHDAARRTSAALRPLRGGPATSTCSPSGTCEARQAERLEVDAHDEIELAVGGHLPGRQLERRATSRGSTPMPVGPRSAGPVTSPARRRRAGPRSRVEATMTRPAIAAGTSAERRRTPSPRPGRRDGTASGRRMRRGSTTAPLRAVPPSSHRPCRSPAPSATMRRRASCSAASAGPSSAARRAGMPSTATIISGRASAAPPAAGRARR